MNTPKVYNLYTMKNVPMKIHLIWLGEEEPNVPYLALIRQIYPDYQIKLWTDEDFDFEEVNDLVKFAIKEKEWPVVSDYFRMKVLLEEGGIFIDTNMEPIKKFEIDSDAKLFMGYEFRNAATNSFIACAQNHLFPKAMVDYYDSIKLPAHLPDGKVVATEILYSLYPELCVKNETKKSRDLQMMDRDAFGLLKPNKNDSYFIHRHPSMSKMRIRLSGIRKLYPAFVQNLRASKLKKNTGNSVKEKMHFQRTNQLVTVVEDAGFLTEELLNKILSYNQGVKVHLHYKNEKLKATLLKIYNVKEVTYGPQQTSHTYEDVPFEEIGNTNTIRKEKGELVFTIKPLKWRVNIETMTNVYSRLFNDGYEKIIYK